MRILVLGLLASLPGLIPLRADTPGAGTNAVSTASRPGAAESTGQVEPAYQQLLDADDAAQREVDQWIQENTRFAERGAARLPEELQQRIEARFAPVRKAYEEFLERHPQHARARLAYGSFLNDIEDEDGAVAQWEKARALDPNNPAAWNNLANHYAHRGPVAKAFEYFDKAIELNPRQPLYCHSLGTCLYLFRTDAMRFYHLSEAQVFDKALALYAQAQKLDPNNFPLATDVAQTYYGIHPLRTEAALKAWNYALRLASDEVEREGIYVHLARINLSAGRLADARRHLDAVTNALYADLKQRLRRNLEEKQRSATNGTPASAGPESRPRP